MKKYTPIVTNDPQDNVSAALNLVYVKNNEGYVRGYGPAPDFADARLYDMARDLLRKYSPETLENQDLTDDNELSCAVAEMLFDGTDTMEGVIALLYTMAWAFAETRERLKMYEDTGLSPTACAKAHEIEDGLNAADYSISRMVELMKADKDGRVVVFLTREEAEKALEARKDG